MAKKTSKYSTLSKIQKSLVDAYRDCRCKTEAYRQAMPGDAEGRTPLQQAKRAHALFTPAVEAAIDEVDAAELAELQRAQRYDALRAAKLWRKSDSVQRLIALLDKCDQDIASGGDRGDKLSDITEEVRKTVEVLDRILGYDAPQVVEDASSHTINVSFGGTDDDENGEFSNFTV